MPEPVGLVGLGNAGAALATALTRSGISLIGFDIDPMRREAVADLPVECVDSLEGLGENARVVIMSLPRADISQSVVDTLLAGSRKPELVIETSTITPADARRLGAACEAAGVRFVDAAIAGGVAGMAAGTNRFLVGGTDEDVALARPTIEAMARELLHLGPVGAGMAAKVVNNAVMHAVMVVLIEAGTMALRAGISMGTLVDLMRSDDGLMRPVTHRVQERMMHGHYEGGMSVSNARKDSVLAIEMAQDLGVPLHAILASHTPYEIAEATGRGDLDYAALAQLWEEWTGVSFTESSHTG